MIEDKLNVPRKQIILDEYNDRVKRKQDELLERQRQEKEEKKIKEKTDYVNRCIKYLHEKKFLR